MEQSITLGGPDGSRLNARVDLDPRGLVLHSRSGVDRNRDYRQALELLMARLDTAGIGYDVYLDSNRVQDLPLEQRKLAFPRNAPIPERFNALVRSMNDGSSSHGAWRRILIKAPGHSVIDLASVVSLELEIGRLSATQLRQVKVEHVDKAVARLLGGEDASNFAPSRDFDLIATNGERLAPRVRTR